MTGRLPLRVVTVAAAAVVLVACTAAESRLGDQPRDNGDVPASATTGTVSPSPEPSAAVADAIVAELEGPSRDLSYGMLTWTVSHAAITTQDPKAYVAGTEGPPTDVTSLVVDFQVRNPDVHVTFLNTTARLVATLPDGEVIAGTDLTRAAVRPESVVDARYAFTVPSGTTFDDVVLAFQDPGRESSFDLPLTGPTPEMEANRTADLDAAMDLAIPGVEMRWTIASVIAGRDWPLPVGFKGGALVPSARAADDRQWVGVVARVDVGRCDCRGGILDQIASARLIVDELPHAAAAAHSTRQILVGSAFSEVMLVFDIPASAVSATLQVGPIDAPDQQASLEIALE